MYKLIILLTVLTCCLSVSIGGISLIHLLLLCLSAAFGIAMLPKMAIETRFSNFLFFYLSPFLISLFISLPVNYVFNDLYPFYELNIIGRIFNLIVISIVTLFLYHLVKFDKIDFKQVLKFYFFGCFIMLISGVWHALDLYFSFPLKFPVETRTNLHSAGGNYSMAFRVTGLAQEPSYLATFIADFVLFTLLLVKSKWKTAVYLFLALFTLYFTFSPSSYLSTLFLLTVYIYLRFRDNKMILVLSITTIVFIVGTFVYINGSQLNLESFYYIEDRLSNVSGSGRFEIIRDAVMSIYNDDRMFTILFGNGFKSFQLFPLRFTENIVETSNNLYVDVFFECGVVGLIILVSFFLIMWKKVISIPIYQVRMFALLLLSDLVITSFYRADFATFRFFLFVTVIFIFIHFSSYVYEKVFKFIN